MVNFMLLFGLKLILSAIFITGFYLITRGQWNTKPDGTKEWSGKIFSFWSKFLQQHKTKKIFYSGDQWVQKMGQLMQFFENPDIIEILDNGVVINKLGYKRMGLFKLFCAENNILFTVREYGNGVLINVYKEEKQFKIPFWITAPLGECITCVSSFWGSFCFWFWYLIGDDKLKSMPTISIVGIWIFFCISLSWVNEFIFHINDKLKS